MNKKKYLLITGILTTTIWLADAYGAIVNPVIQTRFTADPAPYVHGDTIYLYTSHDDDAAEQGFLMRDWLLYTSTDMVNWTDHGIVASLQDFTWGPQDNGAWAVQVVERNGKWYMYCTLHCAGIGVLVSDSPYGPWHDPLGKPLIANSIEDIDPTVWVDDDGQAYLYWGNPNLYLVRLNEDMISYDGAIEKNPGGSLPEDYQEGPWFYRRGPWYYLAYASTCCPEGISYAMSDSPTGPWEKKGTVMGHYPQSNGNHPGIIQYKGKDYLFGFSYQLNQRMSDTFRERRSVCVAELHYNDDGTIQELPFWDEVPPVEPAQSPEPARYRDPSLSAYERAVDLCGRLTLEEKASLMLDESPAIPRLGIKAFHWWSEALHGVANQNNITVFPEPIGMAASFNDTLVERVFDATSTEFRAKWNEQQRGGQGSTKYHALSVWTPNINIFRDPRWGRGQETYGEDPYLTSVMGSAVVRGLQGPEDAPYRKLWACAKHFAIHSGPEWSRHVDNLTDISPRDLWETYLPAFKTLVQDAHVREVMCAYQRWDDEPCCGNTRLLQDILRDEWGFKYLVVSDCGAVSDIWENHKVASDAPHAAQRAVLAGTDVECGFNYVYKSVPEAVSTGLLTEEEVDKHVVRLLEGRFDLGEMDDPDLVPWAGIPTTELNSEEHQQLALDMACQTIVLLQNENDILPLSTGKKIAVIGPNADDAEMLWGNYHGEPNQTITILDGIKRRLRRSQVVAMKGCDLVSSNALESYLDQCQMDGKTGFRCQYWNNGTREGEPVVTTYEKNPIRATTFGQHPFAPGVRLMDFSARYETAFRPRQTSTVLLDVEGCGYFEVFINGESKAMERIWHTVDTRTVFEAEAGKEYKIEIRFAQVENWNANLKINIGHEVPIDYQKAIRRLDGCETVVFVGGISSALEGEEMPVDLPGFRGGDRTNIDLPQVQRDFLRALSDAGKRVVFVCCSGSAIALEPETQACDAIVQAWYGGEQGGEAVARVLFGEYNPSGKLPVTFYRSTEQLPEYTDYSMHGRTYRYMDDPLFPFGYGQSYTQFHVGETSVSSQTITSTDGITLSVPVSNVGKRDGTEVIQLYVRDPEDSAGPSKSLRAFQRVEVKAGTTEQAVFTLDTKTFELFDDTTSTMRTRRGTYEVFYGTSSANSDLKKVLVTIE